MDRAGTFRLSRASSFYIHKAGLCADSSQSKKTSIFQGEVISRRFHPPERLFLKRLFYPQIPKGDDLNMDEHSFFKICIRNTCLFHFFIRVYACTALARSAGASVRGESDELYLSN